MQEEFEDHWRAFDEVIEYARELVGDSATEALGYVMNGQIGVCDFIPKNPRARGISIVAEQWLILTERSSSPVGGLFPTPLKLVR